MRSLETTGVPLGLIPGAKFPAAEIALVPGEKVVIFSDGVSEARGPSGDFYGVERLRRVAASNAAGSWEQMHEAILDDVQAFTQGTPQADDITLVVLEYRH